MRYNHEQLKRAREKSGLTQREVAASMEITERTYQSWELGRTEPRASDIASLARLFGKRMRGFLYVA